MNEQATEIIHDYTVAVVDKNGDILNNWETGEAIEMCPWCGKLAVYSESTNACVYVHRVKVIGGMSAILDRCTYHTDLGWYQHKDGKYVDKGAK